MASPSAKPKRSSPALRAGAGGRVRSATEAVPPSSPLRDPSALSPSSKLRQSPSSAAPGGGDLSEKLRMAEHTCSALNERLVTLCNGQKEEGAHGHQLERERERLDREMRRKDAALAQAVSAAAKADGLAEHYKTQTDQLRRRYARLQAHMWDQTQRGAAVGRTRTSASQLHEPGNALSELSPHSTVSLETVIPRPDEERPHSRGDAQPSHQTTGATPACSEESRTPNKQSRGGANLEPQKLGPSISDQSHAASKSMTLSSPPSSSLAIERFALLLQSELEATKNSLAAREEELERLRNEAVEKAAARREEAIAHSKAELASKQQVRAAADAASEEIAAARRDAEAQIEAARRASEQDKLDSVSAAVRAATDSARAAHDELRRRLTMAETEAAEQAERAAAAEVALAQQRRASESLAARLAEIEARSLHARGIPVHGNDGSKREVQSLTEGPPKRVEQKDAQATGDGREMLSQDGHDGGECVDESGIVYAGCPFRTGFAAETEEPDPSHIGDATTEAAVSKSLGSSKAKRVKLTLSGGRTNLNQPIAAGEMACSNMEFAGSGQRQVSKSTLSPGARGVEMNGLDGHDANVRTADAGMDQVALQDDSRTTAAGKDQSLHELRDVLERALARADRAEDDAKQASAMAAAEQQKAEVAMKAVEELGERIRLAEIEVETAKRDLEAVRSERNEACKAAEEARLEARVAQVVAHRENETSQAALQQLAEVQDCARVASDSAAKAAVMAARRENELLRRLEGMKAAEAMAHHAQSLRGFHDFTGHSSAAWQSNNTEGDYSDLCARLQMANRATARAEAELASERRRIFQLEESLATAQAREQESAAALERERSRVQLMRVRLQELEGQSDGKDIPLAREQTTSDGRGWAVEAQQIGKCQDARPEACTRSPPSPPVWETPPALGIRGGNRRARLFESPSRESLKEESVVGMGATVAVRPDLRADRVDGIRAPHYDFDWDPGANCGPSSNVDRGATSASTAPGCSGTQRAEGVAPRRGVREAVISAAKRDRLRAATAAARISVRCAGCDGSHGIDEISPEPHGTSGLELLNEGLRRKADRLVQEVEEARTSRDSATREAELLRGKLHFADQKKRTAEMKREEAAAAAASATRAAETAKSSLRCAQDELNRLRQSHQQLSTKVEFLNDQLRSAVRFRSNADSRSGRGARLVDVRAPLHSSQRPLHELDEERGISHSQLGGRGTLALMTKGEDEEGAALEMAQAKYVMDLERYARDLEFKLAHSAPTSSHDAPRGLLETTSEPRSTAIGHHEHQSDSDQTIFVEDFHDELYPNVSSAEGFNEQASWDSESVRPLDPDLYDSSQTSSKVLVSTHDKCNEGMGQSDRQSSMARESLRSTTMGTMISPGGDRLSNRSNPSSHVSSSARRISPTATATRILQTAREAIMASPHFSHTAPFDSTSPNKFLVEESARQSTSPQTASPRMIRTANTPAAWQRHGDTSLSTPSGRCKIVSPKAVSTSIELKGSALARGALAELAAS